MRDVPQDAGCLDGHQKLTYAVDETGRYTGVPTIGWETETAATTVSLVATRARIQAAWEAARAGRTSPLGYHMAAAQMDEGQLATDVGLWRWRVRRHLRPAAFAGLSALLLARYADALALGVEALKTLPDAPELP